MTKFNNTNLLILLKKLTHYLLDREHPTGGSKAKFFLDRGFQTENLQALHDASLAHSRHPEAVITKREHASQIEEAGAGVTWSAREHAH